ncbi:MGMT family protein [Amnibacterium flavum]|uniref:DNA-binding protein n=1 Tax=Amnibacterium flavum TaxID=2173173 RepID=A0A2V1HR39_9MICO|nr:MGMT family protein [Amnibacterium flavum]PVZ95025.1 DNA-binding protein [Amnibacterium flavum]
MAVFDTSGEYTAQVIEVVSQIPSGRVMTYGDVAWVFGRPGARAVGMVMRYHGSGLPWWRVLRAGGHPPTGHEDAARSHYEDEGTPLLPADTPAGYRVDLERAAWTPDD